MPRPRKKPNYNPHQIMQEFMLAVADAFGSYDDRDNDTACGLNAVAAEFGITSLKARKLLITAGVYSTALSRRIAKLYSNGAKIEQICSLLFALYQDPVQPCRAVSQCGADTFISGEAGCLYGVPRQNKADGDDKNRAGRSFVGADEPVSRLCVPHGKGIEVYL